MAKTCNNELANEVSINGKFRGKFLLQIAVLILMFGFQDVPWVYGCTRNVVAELF